MLIAILALTLSRALKCEFVSEVLGRVFDVREYCALVNVKLIKFSQHGSLIRHRNSFDRYFRAAFLIKRDVMTKQKKGASLEGDSTVGVLALHAYYGPEVLRLQSRFEEWLLLFYKVE